MTAPRRRWPRFTLRTLFVVVTVSGCALGYIAYQINWMRTRREILWSDRVYEYSTIPPGLVVGPPASKSRRPAAPWTLRAFGERGISLIEIQGDRATADHVRSLFPESAVMLKSGVWLEPVYGFELDNTSD